ncbi:PREDICTED: uncharacterized protein LOC105954060 [Erythranthe guttata]|uniref:uncharacterized protein LOC105954060 n=1 Tax=Erythranthe guttata TaxID=4155 RepID=UPI00064DB6C2|nr:PREDICTED: uncharacterized protein LOC105954060 [Erythranthe guttata]|eukprot:XP_012833184.1 PREDICTED: uncharacterized protein LOC105954060 [Erythranthe guttata]
MRVLVFTNARFLEEDYISNHKSKIQIRIEELEATQSMDSNAPKFQPESTPILVRDSLPITNRRFVENRTNANEPIDNSDPDENERIVENQVEMQETVDNSAPDLSMREIENQPEAPPEPCRSGRMDIKKIFLTGSLEERIYMMQPDGFMAKGQEHMVCKLKKSIYGLKQASRSWNIRFDQAISYFGFDQCPDEPCKYKRIWLSSHINMKDLGETAYILGIKLLRDRKNKMLGLSQTSYIDTIERMKKILYASIVGSLVYAMLCTRLDISYDVGMVSRYQSNPGEEHRTALDIKLAILALSEVNIMDLYKHSMQYIVMIVNWFLSVDAIDMSGKHEVDLDTNIWKVRRMA